MNGITIITFLVFAFIAVSHGHPHSRVRNNLFPLQNIYRDSSCSCSCDDLGALVALVRALEEKECCTTTPTSNGCINNADNLIMNLVDALITLTTQALSRNNCHCPNPGGTNNNPTPCHNGHNGGSDHNGGPGHSHPDGGLLNVDLLNPNKKDNVLDVDLAKQHLVGVGLGGGGGRSANGGSDEGSGPPKPTTGGSPPSQTGNSNNPSSSNGSNSGEGLINVDLLNPDKQDNVAEVDLAKQNLIGIGLGKKKEGTV